MRDDREKLQDILEAIERIDRYITMVWLAVEQELPSLQQAITDFVRSL